MRQRAIVVDDLAAGRRRHLRIRIGTPMETVLIIALALICTLLPLVIGQRMGCAPYVSPMYFLGYFCGLGFFLKAAAYAVVPELAFFQQFTPSPSAQLRGALYLSLFIILICVGYIAFARPVSHAQSQEAARLIASQICRRDWLFTGAFTFAAITFALVLRARGVGVFDPALLAGLNATKQINVNDAGVGATLAGIKTFFIIPKFAFVLLLANGIVLRARRVIAQAAIVGVLLIGIAVISGDRFELIELLVYAFATYAILGGQIAARTVFLTILGLFAVMVVSAYMTQLRFHGAQVSLFQQIVGSTYFLDLNVAVMVTDRTEFEQLLHGESYTWWLFGWVPRAIWLEKPAIDLGVYFKREIMQTFTGGAFNVTGPGEAFINFGWFGLGVAPVLGAIYRKGEEILLNATQVLRHGSYLLYPMLFYPFVQATLQSSFSAFIVGAAAQSVLLLLMLALFVPCFRPCLLPKSGVCYAA
ncbi:MULTISPECIES: O-antigen polymerase [Rhodobacterales]|uniref:O-antigen polymerase n=1 Tax=Rhodobacterales TaxID=204455 RepID=UPI00215DA4C6|nr:MULTISPECIES: O-antigen polymerase [Rhodobacterales]MDO6588959.1 O-antigen polymerase [Yoonia sp. 1_MG-2023]